MEESVELIKLVGLEELEQKEIDLLLPTNRTRAEEAGIAETEIAGVVEATTRRKSR